MENENKTSDNVVDEAKKVVTTLQAENARLETNLKQLREIEARNILGGKSEGKTQEAPLKVETAKEYADKVLSGKIK